MAFKFERLDVAISPQQNWLREEIVEYHTEL
jgi:hypothetical protein